MSRSRVLLQVPRHHQRAVGLGRRHLRHSGSGPENAQQPHLSDGDGLLHRGLLCVFLQPCQGEWLQKIVYDEYHMICLLMQ